jgi:hypothetical protein
MNNNLNKIIIFLIYCTGIIIIYPVLVYYLKSLQIVNLLPLLPKQIFIQVFVSSPLLILVWLLLFFKFKHKIFGIFFFVTGIFWLIGIFYELFLKNGL